LQQFRWCLNLALRTIDQILNCESTFDSEDLVEVRENLEKFIFSNRCQLLLILLFRPMHNQYVLFSAIYL